MTVTVHVYKTRNPLSSQPWRWKAVAANGRKIANGGESYTNLTDLKSALRLLFSDNTSVYLDEGNGAERSTLRLAR
jgi:hypothetical protein